MKINKKLVEISVYLLIKIGISILLTWVIMNHFCFSPEISSTFVGVIMGYSFTALFLFMGLPREGFIKEIDEQKYTSYYAFFIGLPSFIGILSSIFLSLKIIGYFSVFLFSFTLLSFGFSIIIIFLIMYKARKFKPLTRKSA